MFRPSTAQQQSSPATLRLFAQVIPTGLEITVFKQKGHLQKQQAHPIVLALPGAWKAALPHHALNQKYVVVNHQETKPQRLTSVTPLRGKP